jgi:hypothetical protein
MHRNVYQRFSDDEIKAFYREREGVWDTVGDELKERLRAQGIHSIPQALAVQRFADHVTEERSKGILENLRHAAFKLASDG